MSNCNNSMKKWFDDYKIKTIYDRAVPNIMDGLKPVQRKILFNAVNNLWSGKSINTGAFSGMVKAEANYHHGDASRDSAIISLTSTFSNQLPMFVGEGNFGCRIEKSAAATRYTSVRLNPEFKKLMIMSEVLNFEKQDDNNTYEPDYYIFAIPMVLVNGISGIAVSLRTEILGYKIDDIRDNVLRVLHGKEQFEMTPFFPEFSGKIVKDLDNIFIQVGNVSKISSTQLEITEIPTYYDRAKYISILQGLKDTGVISSYADESTDSFLIKISVTRKQMESIESIGLEKALKLTARIRESIKVLSPDGKSVLEFSNPNELISNYVPEFLKLVMKYIKYKENEYRNLIIDLEYKIEFSKFVSSNIDFSKIKINQLAEMVTLETNIPTIDIAKKLISSMTFSSVSKESVDRYTSQLDEYRKEFKYYSEDAKPELLYEQILISE